MSYEFGDKILYNGQEAVYLHVSGSMDDLHWVAIKTAEYEIKNTWAHDYEIALCSSISDVPEEEKINVRDKMIFLHGQISSLMFHIPQDSSDNLDMIATGFDKVMSLLFPDYEQI